MGWFVHEEIISLNCEQFTRQLKIALPPGTIMPNVVRGTSTIVSTSTEALTYRRGSSRIRVRIRDLYRTLENLADRTVTTSELKACFPEIYDSARGGHNCNTTTLFMALRQMGLVESIQVAGVAHDPFRVHIPANASRADLHH